MELWCAVEIGRDFDSCVRASPSSTQSFCRKKEVKFFSKDENKATVAFLCASLFLSLSLCVLSYTLFSPPTRRRIIARDYSCSSSSSLHVLLLVLSLYFGEVLLKTTPRRGVCGRFALFLAYFLFCYFWLWAELCALFCSALFLRLHEHVFISIIRLFSPLFIQCVNTLKFLSYRNTHIKIERRR